ncbi:MAG TPA: Ldh family oxidoreductase [Candidatus Binatia bacterium]|nr:Ldh family oxidoreductase [Candidatus Binatia bacterium]
MRHKLGGKVELHGLTPVAPLHALRRAKPSDLRRPKPTPDGEGRSVSSFAKATEDNPLRIHPRSYTRGFLRRRVKEKTVEEPGIGMARINHQKLLRFVTRSFEKLGAPANDAQIAAKALVTADLRGVDTHGVIRFNSHSWYVKWLSEGSMKAKPDIKIIHETGSSALLDGDRGIGMVIGHRAMELAIRKAKESGVGLVGVRNSRHFGMSANYAMQALPHDMIGIAMTNASRQVVPTFGREARFGTNPMCFAVPADREPAFVLDMATTTAAAGKLELAARLGKTVPPGWALDDRAEQTTDPRTAQKARRLLPLGGSRDGGSHKGYGLAIVVEILCGVLTGTMTALNADQDPRGHFFGAIRIDSFRPVSEFKQDMDRLIRELKSTPLVPGQERVYVAGEIEFETAQERAEQGIPLHSSVLEGLRAVSEQLAVPYELE